MTLRHFAERSHWLVFGRTVSVTSWQYYLVNRSTNWVLNLYFLYIVPLTLIFRLQKVWWFLSWVFFQFVANGNSSKCTRPLHIFWWKWALKGSRCACRQRGIVKIQMDSVTCLWRPLIASSYPILHLSVLLNLLYLYSMWHVFLFSFWTRMWMEV